VQELLLQVSSVMHWPMHCFLLKPLLLEYNYEFVL
jgi:hypothetical protein